MKNTPFPYQSDLINDVLESSKNEQYKENVLAAACGGGKSFMGIRIVEAILELDSKLKVLIQMFSRLVRIHPEGKDKLFLKVVPEMMAGYTWAVMSFVLALAHKSVYDTYMGDYRNTRVPMKREYIERMETITKKERTSRSLKFEELPSLPTYNLFKSLWNKDGELINSYGYTTLQDVKNYFAPKDFYSLEEFQSVCKANSLDSCLKYRKFYKENNDSRLTSRPDNTYKMSWRELFGKEKTSNHNKEIDMKNEKEASELF